MRCADGKRWFSRGMIARYPLNFNFKYICFAKFYNFFYSFIFFVSHTTKLPLCFQVWFRVFRRRQKKMSVSRALSGKRYENVRTNLDTFDTVNKTRLEDVVVRTPKLQRCSPTPPPPPARRRLCNNASSITLGGAFLFGVGVVVSFFF